MKEILFRGKSVETGEWVYGYYAEIKDYLTEKPYHVIFPIDATLFPHGEISSFEIVWPETVGQYTGIPDKNSNKIFEGDVIDLPRWYVAYCGDVQEGLGMNAGWYYVRDNFESWSELECNRNHEILGNVHDNPELLER